MSRVGSLALLGVVVALSGCAYSWSTPRPQARSIIETHPAQVRVTRTDGRRLIVRHPSIQGDSLLGAMVFERSDDLPSSGAIPLGEVRSVSTRDFSLGMTALRVVLVAGVTYGVSYAVIALTFGSMHL